MAANVGQVSKPEPVSAGANLLKLQVPSVPSVGETFAVSLHLDAVGSVLGISIALDWDPAIVEPVAYRIGELLETQAGHGVFLSPAMGAVDAVVIGSTLSGAGILGTITFQVRGEGNPRIALKTVLTRGIANKPVVVQLDQEIQDDGVQPTMTQLLPPSANPFMGSTQVRFVLAETAPVSIRVYGVDGRLVRSLVDQVLPAGHRQIDWDGRDDVGREVVAGLYLVRMRAGASSETQRLVRLR